MQRWSFCNLDVLGSERSWKRYFLRRRHLEMKMKKGEAGGYTCKSLRGHTGLLCSLFLSLDFISMTVCPLILFLCLTYLPLGRVVGMVYLQSNSSQSPELWNSSAIVCSASTDGTVRAWNIQKVSGHLQHFLILYRTFQKCCIFTGDVI